MARYLEKWSSAEALQFDGTRASALAIAKAFPGKAARHIEHDDVLLVLCCDLFAREELREMPIGAWLVRREPLSGRLALIKNDFFTAYFKRIDP